MNALLDSHAYTLLYSTHNYTHTLTSALLQEQTTGDSLHPWATNPQSIGALATTQIAALASVEDMNVKERIRSADAIPALVEQLQSDVS